MTPTTDFEALERRLSDRVGFDIKPFLDTWPKTQDDKCWLAPHLISLHNRKHTAVRLVFAVMIGELLDTTHFVRRKCSTFACCNPAHNEVRPRAHKGHPPKPLHARLFNSDIPDEDEVQDIRDLISGQNLTTVDEVSTYLDGMYDRDKIEEALSNDQ
jgi:hypothetical protein